MVQRRQPNLDWPLLHQQVHLQEAVAEARAPLPPQSSRRSQPACQQNRRHQARYPSATQPHSNIKPQLQT
jgi:hypothetical protein